MADSRRKQSGLPACGFLVMATKGGQVPVSIEKRAKGKKVTVISGVQGNASALCSALTRILGIGGTTHARGALCADVEVQGEQVKRVTEVLGQLACVRGLPKAKETAAVVVHRDCAYDSLLAQQGGRTKPRAAKTAPAAPEPPEDAPCRAWHGSWIYCCGNCAKIDSNDIWADSNCNPDFRPAPRASRRGVMDAAGLNKALKPLGMTAEVGAAVQEWMNHQTQVAKEAERKRSMPIASLCAAAPVQPKGAALVCDECGAEFALKRTLKLHKQAHKREREEAGVWDAGVSDVQWRRTSAENAAALEAKAEEDYAWAGSDMCGSSSDEQQSQSRAAPSLASWLTAAARPARDNRRRVQKPNPRTQLANGPNLGVQQVPCPICCEKFSVMDIEQHVEVCLAASAQQADEAEPMPSFTADERSLTEGEDGTLSLELLHTLLEMELSEEATERFWQRFEDVTAAGSSAMQDAFLMAVEAALQEDPLDATLEDPSQMRPPSRGRHQEDPDEAGWEIQKKRPAGKSRRERYPEDPEEACPSKQVLASEGQLHKSAGSEPQAGSKRWTKKAAVKDSNGSTSREAGRWGRAPQEEHPGQPKADLVAQAEAQFNATQSRSGQILGEAPRSSKSSAVPAPCPSCGLAFLPEILELHASQCAARHSGSASLGATDHADWLRAALTPLLGGDSAESVAAGVEVVIEHGDDEAAANAVELVAAELPRSGPEAARADIILAEFSARLFSA